MIIIFAVAVGNAVASFKTMLAFYGLDIVDDATGEIARVVDSVEPAERYRNLNTKAHNYRRITRISKYLGSFLFLFFNRQYDWILNNIVNDILFVTLKC